MELFLEKEKEKELSGYMRSTVSPSKKLIIINILNYTYTHGHYKNLFFNTRKHEHKNEDTISTPVQDRQYEISA